MTDLGNEQSSLREQRTSDIAAPRAPEYMITFAVAGGIFGVGRLAAQLDELSQSGTDRCLAHRSVGRLGAYGDPDQIRQR